MGLAAAATVVIAVLVAITLLPAIMGFAGERLRAARPRRCGRPSTRARRATAGARFVTTHPIITLVVARARAAHRSRSPRSSLRLGLPDAGREPEGSGDRAAYDLLAEGFGPGFNGPLVVLVDAGRATRPRCRPRSRPSTATVSALPDVAYAAPVAAPGAAEGADGRARRRHPDRRARTPRRPPTWCTPSATPARTLEASTGTQLWVTGAAAANIDITEKLADAFPLFLLIVVGLAIVLLLRRVPLAAGAGHRGARLPADHRRRVRRDDRRVPVGLAVAASSTSTRPARCSASCRSCWSACCSGWRWTTRCSWCPGCARSTCTAPSRRRRSASGSPTAPAWCWPRR